MKLFLSWSGDRSEALAQAVEQLLQELNGGVETHLSTNIPKGGTWNDELMTNLGSSDAVLICLTPEAVASTWITFEAGYIVARAKNPRVFTLLYDVSPADIPDALSRYQSTLVEEDDMWRLVKDMTGAVVYPDTWDVAWESFDGNVAAIAPLQLNQIAPEIENWFRRKTFDEPVHHCLDQSWIDRYRGVVETLEKLRSVNQDMANAGQGFAAEIFVGLIAAVDSYATAIRGILLDQRPAMPIGADGALSFDIPGDLEALEERRKRVKTLLNNGVALAPFAQSEAFFFERLETFSEKKDLVHRKRAQLRRDLQDPGRLTAEMVQSWRESEWAFDRISAYLVDTMKLLDPDHDVVQAADDELEKARAIDGKTLMPLHYALKPVEAATAASSLDREQLKQLLADVQRFMVSLDDPDKTRGPDSLMQRIRDRMKSDS